MIIFAITSLFAPKTGPQALFRDLCQLHEIDKKTLKLLTQIATELNLEQPGMTFVDPEIIRKAASMPVFSDSLDTLRELYYKWFGGTI